MTDGVDGLLRDKRRPCVDPALGADDHRSRDRANRNRTASPGHPLDGGGDGQGQTGISVSSVQRIWRAHKLQPHRVRSFKLSTNPQFAASLSDIAGLYIDPPAHAVGHLGRREVANPSPRSDPTGPAPEKGRITTMTHDYKRHGTTTLFAALDVLEGKVIGRCACSAIAIRSSSASSIRSRPPCRSARSCASSSTTTPPTSTRRSRVAGAPPALRLPLHADLLLLAQCRRGSLRQAHPAPSPTRRLSLDRRAPGRHQPLRRRSQRQSETLRLDRRARIKSSPP